MQCHIAWVHPEELGGRTRRHVEVPTSVRDRFDGLGPYLAGGAVLLLLALMGVLLLLQSPSDKLLWTGHKVTGSERSGLVYYEWHGSTYALDVPGFFSKPDVTVFVDPADPETGIIDSTPRRVLDVLFTVVPLVLGIGVLMFGVRRRRSEKRTVPNDFGRGLDPELVDRLLGQIRQPPP